MWEIEEKNQQNFEIAKVKNSDKITTKLKKEDKHEFDNWK